jgi:hypothetical protein
MKMRHAAVAVLVAAALADTGSALPRFASRTGSKCQSCHVNPSGGAMRQAFGAQYGREVLPVPEWSKEMELEDFSNIIANVLGVGADFRMLYFSRSIPNSSSLNGFWQMQGDLYLNFRVAKKVNLFFKKGLREGFEVFGLFNVLPASGHIKVGKFLPNYGMKIDDHTTYVRQVTGFSPEAGRMERAGLEAGISPGAFTIMGGVYNGDENASFPPGSSNKAFLGRAEGLFRLDDNITAGLGGNLFTAKRPGSTMTCSGGFGSFTWDRFTLLAEGDVVSTKGPTGSTVKQLVTYVEADYVLTPGFDLKLAYDFRDFDIDFKTGTISRYSVGVEFFPLGGVEVRPIYRIVKEDPDKGNKNEFHLLLHLYI